MIFPRFDLLGLFSFILGLLLLTLPFLSSIYEFLGFSVFFILVSSFTLFFWKNFRLTISYFLFWTLLIYTFGFIRIKILENLPIESVVTILLLISICLLFFILFYLGFESKKISFKLFSSGWLMQFEKALFSTRVLWCSIFLFTLFMAFQVLFAGGVSNYVFQSYGTRNDPTMSYMFVLRGIAKGSLTTIVLARMVFLKRPYISWLVYFMIIVFSVIDGSTGFLLTIPLQFGVLFFFKLISQNKFRKINRLVLIILLFLPLGFLLSSTTRLARSGSDDMVSLFYGRTFDALENTIRINSFYSPGETLGINTFVYPLVTNIIPRKIWPSKPVGLGRQIMWDIYGAPDDTPVSFVPGFLGELYVDFGYVLGVLVFGFFGIIVRILDETILLLKNKKLYGSLTFFLLLALLSSNIPNSLQGFTLRIILGVLQIPLLLIFYKITKVLSLPKKLHKRS